MFHLLLKNKKLLIADAIMEKTLARAKKAAQSEAPVFLSGESGTGKELIARFIHEHAKNRTGPFVTVNCAAIPEGLLEAELFGYEKGAFTGAYIQRLGKFERAHGGTLLLDEVSEMPTHLQAKLLRVLQEGEVDRLGSKSPIEVQVRVIATTNQDPIQLVKEGKFRHDLFYRLNVFSIFCESLKNRMEAIENFAKWFVVQACEKHEKTAIELTPAAMEKLKNYEWPGNIRELQNILERAVVLADGSKLDVDALELYAMQNLAHDSSLGELEKGHILKTLEQTAGNRTETARKLKISVRTLRNKLKEYEG